MVGPKHGLTPEEIAKGRTRRVRCARQSPQVRRRRPLWLPTPAVSDGVDSGHREVRRECEGVSYDTVCVVGIGGSALGAWALDCGIRGTHPVQGAFSAAFPRLVILDNVDPDFIASALRSMNAKKTLVVVIAKSGGTAETVATFMIVKEWLSAAIGRKASQRIGRRYVRRARRLESSRRAGEVHHVPPAG